MCYYNPDIKGIVASDGTISGIPEFLNIGISREEKAMLEEDHNIIMKCPYCNKRSLYTVEQADEFNWLCLNCGQLFSTEEEKTLVFFF